MITTSMAPMHQLVVTLDCPDRPGIVHAITGGIVAAHGNITELQQFSSPDTGHFFTRIEVHGAEPESLAAAVGAAAIYVPFPSAVDDHQTANARYLVDVGAGWLVPQSTLTARGLADMLQNMQRATLLERAELAKKMQKIDATAQVVAACEELAP